LQHGVPSLRQRLEIAAADLRDTANHCGASESNQQTKYRQAEFETREKRASTIFAPHEFACSLVISSRSTPNCGAAIV
jgi:hypothetical protein